MKNKPKKPYHRGGGAGNEQQINLSIRSVRHELLNRIIQYEHQIRSIGKEIKSLSLKMDGVLNFLVKQKHFKSYKEARLAIEGMGEESSVIIDGIIKGNVFVSVYNVIPSMRNIMEKNEIN